MKTLVWIALLFGMCTILGMVHDNPASLEAMMLRLSSPKNALSANRSTRLPVGTPATPSVNYAARLGELAVDIPARHHTARARLAYYDLTSLPTDIGVLRSSDSSAEMYEAFRKRPAYSKTGIGYGYSTGGSGGGGIAIGGRSISSGHRHRMSGSSNGFATINNSRGSTGNFDSKDFASLGHDNEVGSSGFATLRSSNR